MESLIAATGQYSGVSNSYIGSGGGLNFIRSKQ